MCMRLICIGYWGNSWQECDPERLLFKINQCTSSWGGEIVQSYALRLSHSSVICFAASDAGHLELLIAIWHMLSIMLSLNVSYNDWNLATGRPSFLFETLYRDIIFFTLCEFLGSCTGPQGLWQRCDRETHKTLPKPGWRWSLWLL